MLVSITASANYLLISRVAMRNTEGRPAAYLVIE
jgi:hypothetical protein